MTLVLYGLVVIGAVLAVAYLGLVAYFWYHNRPTAFDRPL